MRRHHTYEQLLARSDELTEPERERLLAHLSTCERCRREQRALRAHDDLLRRFAGARPPVSLDAEVLDRIGRNPSPPVEIKSRRWVRAVPAVGGLVLAASLLLAAGLALEQRFQPTPARPTAVAAHGNCTVAGASWEMVGPCQIAASPDALRSSSVTYYPLALQWAKRHLRNPKYIVRRNDRIPVLIRRSGAAISFSEVARDKQSHRSVYVVGEEQ